MKISPAETVNRFNVEHRTSNIERWILMTLSEPEATLYRFYKKRTVKFRSVDKPPAFVAISAEPAYAAFF